MGFLASASTVTLTAKLTPFGRQQLLLNSNSIITKFSLGDTDANYYIDEPLENGKVPTMAGEVGPNNTISNGLYHDSDIKSPIIVNALGDIKKNIQVGSNAVVITPLFNGITTLSGASLTQLTIDRTDANDGNSNLFHTFGLPITQAQQDLYALFNTSEGGYLDTAIRNLNVDKVMVIAIDTCSYGEIIDGKSIKLDITTSGTPITAYGTYEKSTTALTVEDGKLKDDRPLANSISQNVAFLFSDYIEFPNQDSLKSWSTGHSTTKPFSLGGKNLFNSVSVPTTSTFVDEAIGIAYLDRGFIVITNQAIIDGWDANETKVKFNHVSNEVSQNITCFVERDEFATTNNVTHSNGEPIRVSEVALYDNSNNVIAVAKSNTHILIGANQFMAVGVKILV